jgi:hypothetical protein
MPTVRLISGAVGLHTASEVPIELLSLAWPWRITAMVVDFARISVILREGHSGGGTLAVPQEEGH